MATILQLNPGAFKKFDYKPVKKSKRIDLEKHGQLNLFAPPSREAKVIQLKSDLSPFEQGLLLDEKGDNNARIFYEKAIAADDYTADAYCNLGIIESKEGNTARAIDCFTKSLERNPRHFESHFDLANLYFDLNDLKLAKLHYQVAAEIQPEYPNVYFNLALVYAMLNELHDSVDTLKKFKSFSRVSEHKSADALLNKLQNTLKEKPKRISDRP